MTCSPPWGSDTARAHGAAIVGADGHLIRVTAQISNGLAALHTHGLPEPGARETRDRIRAAILNSALPWPARTITVRLQPEFLTRSGSGLDLPIAVAILAAAGAIPAQALKGCVFAAELCLDGSLRPVHGVAAALTAAARAGCDRAAVAEQNRAEAAIVPGIVVLACRSLSELAARLRAGPARRQPEAPAITPAATSLPAVGLEELEVSPVVRLALETTATGGHHLCLTGPPGAPITALAAGVARLLPPLDDQQAAEVTAIHSVAGLLDPARAQVTRPPFRAPHHTATLAAMLGGGTVIRPGEAALAHHGVLFLADAPEFARPTLHALRQVLHDGQVAVARSGRLVRYPAKFILMAGCA